MSLSWSGGHALHTLEPLMANMSAALNALVPHQGEFHTLARLLLTVLTSPDPDERAAAYTTTVSAARAGDFRLGETYWTLLYTALADDEVATVPLLRDAIVATANPRTVALIRCISRLHREISNAASANRSWSFDDLEKMAGADG